MPAFSSIEFFMESDDTKVMAKEKGFQKCSNVSFENTEQVLYKYL